MQGDLDTAGSLTEQVHALAARLGDQESVALALLTLGMVAVAQGACDKARRTLRNVLDIAVQACIGDLR